MEAKISFFDVFFRCFFRMRFGIDFGSILGGSKAEKYQFRQKKTRFFTKSAFSKNAVKIIDFGCIFGGQHGEKSLKNDVEKHVIF